MKVEIDLSPKTIRMIQALNVLRGKKGGSDIETLLSKVVQKSLKQQFAEELELDVNSSEPDADVKIPPSEKQEVSQESEQSQSQENMSPMAIDQGLGDEFNYDEQVEETSSGPDEQALVPDSGGLTEKDLEADNAVADPEKEANVEAPPSKTEPQESGEAEETFQQMMFDDESSEYVDQRVAKRRYKNKNARRARVQPYSGEGGEGSASDAVEAKL